MEEFFLRGKKFVLLKSIEDKINPEANKTTSKIVSSAVKMSLRTCPYEMMEDIGKYLFEKGIGETILVPTYNKSFFSSALFAVAFNHHWEPGMRLDKRGDVSWKWDLRYLWLFSKTGAE